MQPTNSDPNNRAQRRDIRDAAVADGGIQESRCQRWKHLRANRRRRGDQRRCHQPGPTPFTSGDVSGSIYRYVVWRNDESCPETKCPGTQDYKQVIVAVKLDKAGNLATQRGYVEVQSDFVDPTDSASQGPDRRVDGQRRHRAAVLSHRHPLLVQRVDDPSGNQPLIMSSTTPSAPVQTGRQTGSSRGAPDALLTGAPPDPAPEDENNPPCTSIRKIPICSRDSRSASDDTNGCHYVPSGISTPQAQIHRWVTDPMAKNFRMTKNVTIEFYTRALNDETHHRNRVRVPVQTTRSGKPAGRDRHPARRCEKSRPTHTGPTRGRRAKRRFGPSSNGHGFG